MCTAMALIYGLHFHYYPPVCFIAAAFITGGRIVFALTKYDSCFTGFDKEPTLSETTHHVKDGLMKLGFDVSPADIVPVSGQWALLARKLLADPQKKSLIRHAQSNLIAYREKQPHGQDEESIEDEVCNMEAQDMARELERASRISVLEERSVNVYYCTQVS